MNGRKRPSTRAGDQATVLGLFQQLSSGADIGSGRYHETRERRGGFQLRRSRGGDGHWTRVLARSGGDVSVWIAEHALGLCDGFSEPLSHVLRG